MKHSILFSILLIAVVSCKVSSTQIRTPNEYKVTEIISQSEKSSVVRLENSNGSQLKGRYVFPTDTLKRQDKISVYWVIKL